MRSSLPLLHLLPLLLVLFASACGPDQPRTSRPRRAAQAAPMDSVFPPDVRVPFEPPESWEHVQLARVEYRQPPGFTMGLNDHMVGDCDAQTLEADAPLFPRTFGERWPLAFAMRRGDLARLARANGFVLDSTIIATEGQRGDSTALRRGEGWLLLSGHTHGREGRLPVVFGAIRYPGGCYLVLAGRGVDINVDTLGYVLSTLRVVATP